MTAGRTVHAVLEAVLVAARALERFRSNSLLLVMLQVVVGARLAHSRREELQAHAAL